jgi:hypothetical protein
MATKSEAQWVVYLGGLFKQVAVTEFSGGELTRAKDNYPKATTDDQGYVLGNLTYGDITIRDPYDPAKHDPMIEVFLNYCGQPIDIVAQALTVCPNRTNDGRRKIYPNCAPIYCSPVPNINRGGNTTARFELRFAPGGFKLG